MNDIEKRESASFAVKTVAAAVVGVTVGSQFVHAADIACFKRPPRYMCPVVPAHLPHIPEIVFNTSTSTSTAGPAGIVQIVR